MSVIRKHHNKNYTVMSNYHFKDKELSLKAKGLLSLMLSLPDDWDYSTSGLETLSKDGNTSVRSALKELEENEYLVRERLYKDGKIADWTYHIFESKEDCQQFKQDVENKHVETQHVKNNNNKVNNNKITKKQSKKSNTKVLLEETSSSQNEDFLSSSKKPKKQNKYEKCVSMIDDFTSDSKIRKLLIQYLNMRLEIKDKPMYANQWKGMLNKLKDMDNIQDVIQQSIDRGYLGFFPVKKYQSAYNDRDKFCEPENYKTRIYEGEEKEKAEAFRERMRKQGKQVTF